MPEAEAFAPAPAPKQHLAAIALGSNLGDRTVHLRTAVERIGLLGQVQAVSSSFDTAPVGFLAQPRFLNAALLLLTSLPPRDLMHRLLAIENSLGRTRASVPPKGPRVLDLDLLLYDDLLLDTPDLTLPHPAMAERDFVLRPLAEIAPHLLHPRLGRSIASLLESLQTPASHATLPRNQPRIIEAMASPPLPDPATPPDALQPDELPEQLGLLPTEARNPRSEHLDQLSTLDMLRLINDEDATVASAVRQVLPQIASAVEAIAERFSRGGRLFYLGAGTSGRLGVLDASECPPTFSVPPGLFVGLIAGGDSALRRSSEASEDSAEAGAGDLDVYRPAPEDSVLGIAASGRTPYVLGALHHARKAGCLTLALTCAGGAAQPSRMAQIVDHPIELATGPEILTGSTRMKAGTATKLVLNMLSTAVMVLRGAVSGNLMVDLQPSNAKLQDRALRIITAATGCDPNLAQSLLAHARSVKLAIVMQRFACDLPQARRLLAANNGHIPHTSL